MGITCCKDCVAPKRYPGCHGRCQEYIEQKAKHDKEVAADRKAKRISYGIIAQRTAAVKKAQRKGRKQDGK